MSLRSALPRTLAAHRPACLYSIAAVTWAGAIAAAAEDVDTDIMVLVVVAALASALIAFQHAAFLRHQAASEETRRATDALTRAILTRPHERDHEETGPFATVSGLRALSGQRANRG